MGDISEFPLHIRLFLKTYRWRKIDPIPWTPLKKPLDQCKLALVSTAGFVLPDQKPFDNTIKGGDWSYRIIPGDIDLKVLIDSHRSKSFDHSGMHQDPNLVFPLDRLKELVQSGRIGAINHRHISLMGSITAPAKLIKFTAPEIARIFLEDQVDAALLIPV